MRSLWKLGVVVLATLAMAGTASAGAPTTRPAGGADETGAKLSPAAQALLETMSQEYRKVPALEMSGTFKLSLSEDGRTRSEHTGFESSYLAPGMYRHAADGQPVLGSSGKVAYAFFKEEGAYLQSDVQDGPGVLEKLPESQRTVLLKQNPMLALLLSGDAGKTLRALSKKLELAGDRKVDDVDCAVVKMELVDGGDPAELLVEKSNGQIRRYQVDMTARVNKQGRPDLKDVLWTVDYTQVRTGVQPAPAQFAWAPPAGARELSEGGGMADGGGGEPSALLGKPAPDFSLKDLDGKTVQLSELKGSVVVLDFWATWCGPCRASMPHLNRLNEKLKDQGLRLFAVNQRETRQQVQKFMEANKYTMAALLDVKGEVGNKYGVSGIPTTVLIGRDGVVKKVHVGFGGDGDGLEGEVEAQLKVGH